MCAWPAARRPFHRGRLARWWRPSYGFGQNRIENARDRLAWWWEKQSTCRIGRHHAKMDSWPHCYRCGKQLGTMVGVAEPTFDPAACTCLADRDPAPDAHLEGCRAWAVWR